MELKIHVDGDNCWPDLKETRIWHGTIEEAAYLEGGMSGGSPSVALRIEADGSTSTMIAQTSLKLFLGVAAAFCGKAKHDGVDCWKGPEAEVLAREEGALLAQIFGDAAIVEAYSYPMRLKLRALHEKILRQFVVEPGPER